MKKKKADLSENWQKKLKKKKGTQIFYILYGEG